MSTPGPLLSVLFLLAAAGSLAPEARAESVPPGPEAGPRLSTPQVREALGRWQDPAAAAVDSLLAIYRDPEDPRHLEACAAAVALGEDALERGDLEFAAAVGIHVYLSSAPEDLRGRSLVLLARGNHPQASLRLGHILQGRLDLQWLWLARQLAAERGSAAADC